MDLQRSLPATRASRPRVTLCASVLFLAACGSEELGPPLTVRDSAGTTVVENDYRQPAWTAETAWRLSPSPRLQVGNQPGDPSQRLYQVEHSRLLADGGLAVVNAGLGDVRLYDANGFHVRTIPLFPPDGSGATPRLQRIYGLPGDSLLVLLSNASLVVLGPEGGIGRSATLAVPEGGLEWPPQPVGALADGTFLVRAYVPFDSTRTGLQRHHVRVLRYGVDGRLLGSFGDFEAEAELVGEEVLVFGPSGYQAAGDSTLWQGNAERFDVREVAQDGRTVRIVRVDLPGQPVARADTFAFRQAAVRQMSDTAGEEGALRIAANYVYEDTFPAYDQIFVDDVGDVWVRSYQWFELGAEKLWNVFDPSGRHLGRVITPWLLEIHQIGDDFILGSMSDRRGQEAVYLYGLEKPNPAAGPP